MAQFYGSVKGVRGWSGSRLGSIASGLETVAASWRGAVKVRLFVEDGEDCYRVSLIPWHGKGQELVIAEGVLGEAPRSL